MSEYHPQFYMCMHLFSSSRPPAAELSRLVPANWCGLGPLSVRVIRWLPRPILFIRRNKTASPFPLYDARTKGASFRRSDVHRPVLQHLDQCKYRTSCASSFHRVVAPPATATTPDPATSIWRRKCSAVQKTIRRYVHARVSAAFAYNLLSESLDLCKRPE